MALPPLGASDAASALVRAYCGWHVAPVLEETLTLDTREGGSLLLPTLRLVDIDAATYDGKDILDGLEWSADGMIRYPFRRKFRSLTVAIRHGFEPDTVAPLVDRIASRLTTQVGGVKRTRRVTGPYQQDLEFSAGGSGLLAEDRDALLPYRLTWGP